MKKIATISFAVCLSVAISAQTVQKISTAAGYQKQSYVNLSAGTEKQVANTAWDIAFTVYGQQDAGVFANESSGSSMGAPLPLVEIYDALTDNFNDQPDPAGLLDYPLFNKEKTWAYGAFNERRDPDNALDFGWGAYNPPTAEVIGNWVYVVKLRSGDYRKIKIESLIGGVYTFRYAHLDGTNEVVKTINKADHAGKTLAYFNLETNSVVDVEPASGGFDLLYCRYITELLDPGTMEYILYYVTGVLTGPGGKVAEADGVDPVTVAYADYQDSLHTALDVIGHDWKYFSGTAWSLDADRVFFLKTANDRVWKLQFIGFEGSTTGAAVLEKTDLGIISAVQDPAALGLGVTTYPNPVQEQLSVLLDIPATLAQNAQLQVMDLQGRIVLDQSFVLKEGFQVLQLSATSFASGMYVLKLQLPEQTVNLGKIVKL
ncbi:MAG: T9SS type A sorting domain-containing protein [Phycisphaerae bacterium]|nr:T9SS type A sorting domain-containing protein [Saprospiraceae bacterium]